MSGWTKEDPKVDGVYWWRADSNDNEPDIHSVVNGHFYETGTMKREKVENFDGEWLGPISPSNLEELIRLRDWKESVMTLLAHYDSIAETFGGKLGSSKIDNLERGVEQLRDGLAQRRGEKSQ